MVLEKTLESPLDCKEIQPVHSEGDQPWDFFGFTKTPMEAVSIPSISSCVVVTDAFILLRAGVPTEGEINAGAQPESLQG